MTTTLKRSWIARLSVGMQLQSPDAYRDKHTRTTKGNSSPVVRIVRPRRVLLTSNASSMDRYTLAAPRRPSPAPSHRIRAKLADPGFLSSTTTTRRRRNVKASNTWGVTGIVTISHRGLSAKLSVESEVGLPCLSFNYLACSFQVALMAEFLSGIVPERCRPARRRRADVLVRTSALQSV